MEKSKKRSQRKQRKAFSGFTRFINNDPFKPEQVYNMSYGSQDVITGGTSGLIGTTKTFGLNNMYDPDVSGTGHQPYGYDQLLSSTGPYSRYKVLGVKGKLTLANPSSANGVWIAIAIHPAGSSATISTLDGGMVAEKHNTKVIFVPASGDQQKVFHFTFWSTFNELFGFTKTQFNAESANTTGPYNNQPGSRPRLEIGAFHPTIDSVASTVLTQLTFKARLYDRVQLATS